MATSVTWLGHGTFSVDIDEHNVLIDPFLTGNPAASTNADSLVPNFILVSHGHGDHIADAASIAKRTGATCIGVLEIANWLGAQGVENVHGQQIGGGYNHPFGYLKLAIAHHGSVLPDGSYGGLAAGFLITTGDDKTLYFACDTGIFSEMEFYGDDGIDIAFLPIGDNYTMGPDDALKAVKMLRPKVVVPVHYSTWPVIEQDAEAWAKRVADETSSNVSVMKPGDSIDV